MVNQFIAPAGLTNAGVVGSQSPNVIYDRNINYLPAGLTMQGLLVLTCLTSVMTCKSINCPSGTH